MVFHLSRCELTMVMIDGVVLAMVGIVEMVNIVMHVVLESAKTKS
jgi:hypothetical protein